MDEQSQGEQGPEHVVHVATERVLLEGELTIPSGAPAIVVFAHGSGSSRHSPRNRSVARALNQNRLATLLFDLLTSEEEEVDNQTGELRFNIELLGRRLAGASDWLRAQPATGTLSLGYFGASTGAAAALVAATLRPRSVSAIVCRGGRPDLAGPSLARVSAPTLLIVGGRDLEVVRLNQEALGRIQGPKELQIISGATHLFPEPGALEQVAALAVDWFHRYVR